MLNSHFFKFYAHNTVLSTEIILPGSYLLSTSLPNSPFMSEYPKSIILFTLSIWVWWGWGYAMDYGYRLVSVGDILLLYLFHRKKMVACILLKVHGYPSFRFLISLAISIMIHIAGIKSNQKWPISLLSFVPQFFWGTYLSGKLLL